MNMAESGTGVYLKTIAPFLLAIGIWFAPIPEGLTQEAWHLFAIFAAAIFAVIINSLPLLTSALLAGSMAVLTYTLDPGKVFAGFANASVLLVVIAFLVAQAVVKCGLGRRISLLVVSVFGKSTLGLAYSIFVASDYLTQRELYRLGLMTTVFCTLIFLIIGTPWVLWVGK